ncbi:MAG TPA: TonB system transport protein TonB, partial [Alphaproteobacteria bacterium]|nr:TonB system transport protein TonB [Alphaproteobacteria bacterium]
NADGQVTDVRVESARPPGWFEEAAVNAVKRWRYPPAKTGRRFRVEVEFKLSD